MSGNNIVQRYEQYLPYGHMKILIENYAYDQNYGERVLEAYRKAIVAAIDDAENLEELIAELKSMDRKVAYGNSRRRACLFCRFSLSDLFD